MHTPSRHTYPVCLSIAGSDPSGGAGIQADLKTFAALGCYGAAAISALTVQNTTGCLRSVAVAPQLLAEQVEAVLSDLRPAAVKLGQLPTLESIAAVADVLRRYRPRWVVCDPVLRATSGLSLAPAGAEAAYREMLFPLVTLLTPNLPELAALSATQDPEAGAQRLLNTTALPAVLVKGGHASGEPIDRLYLRGRETAVEYAGKSVRTRNTHGTGCTLSSAIAAGLARGLALEEAVRQAKRYLQQALEAGSEVYIGAGHGPVNHGFAPIPLRAERTD